VSRSKWGDLQFQVKDCRSQSPHSTAGNIAFPETLVSKAQVRKGGQEGRIRDVDSNAI
jgi:hypothetical protein